MAATTAMLASFFLLPTTLLTATRTLASPHLPPPPFSNALPTAYAREQHACAHVHITAHWIHPTATSANDPSPLSSISRPTDVCCLSRLLFDKIVIAQAPRRPSTSFSTCRSPPSSHQYPHHLYPLTCPSSSVHNPTPSHSSRSFAGHHPLPHSARTRFSEAGRTYVVHACPTEHIYIHLFIYICTSIDISTHRYTDRSTCVCVCVCSVSL